MPRNISLENSQSALGSLACLIVSLALSVLCFSSERLQAFLFNLQLNTERKRQNAILLAVHPSSRMERVAATVAMSISNDILGARGEIIQPKFT